MPPGGYFLESWVQEFPGQFGLWGALQPIFVVVLNEPCFLISPWEGKDPVRAGELTLLRPRRSKLTTCSLRPGDGSSLTQTVEEPQWKLTSLGWRVRIGGRGGCREGNADVASQSVPKGQSKERKPADAPPTQATPLSPGNQGGCSSLRRARIKQSTQEEV